MPSPFIIQSEDSSVLVQMLGRGAQPISTQTPLLQVTSLGVARFRAQITNSFNAQSKLLFKAKAKTFIHKNSPLQLRGINRSHRSNYVLAIVTFYHMLVHKHQVSRLGLNQRPTSTSLLSLAVNMQTSTPWKRVRLR